MSPRAGSAPHRSRIGSRNFEIEFDFIGHVLQIAPSDGAPANRCSSRSSVADFYRRDDAASERTRDSACAISELPNEIPGADPLQPGSRRMRAYDAEQARRFWRVLMQVDRVLKLFRTGFLGKASPVHFFWGSFDLAVTRFSGRPAPPHPGGVPGLARRGRRARPIRTRSAAPGSGRAAAASNRPRSIPTPIPSPRVSGQPRCSPRRRPSTRRSASLCCPTMRCGDRADPDAALLAFLQSTYEAAANAGHWDRAALECPYGAPGVPRVVT